MVSTLHLLAPDLPTGTAKQIGYLTGGLTVGGNRVHVFSFEYDQVRKTRLERFLPQVEYCRQSMPLDPTIVIRCARKIRETAPEIVHCWGTHQSLYTQLALRLAGVTNVVWSARSNAEILSLSKKNHSKSRFVTNADYLSESLRENYPYVETVSNGVVAAEAAKVVAPLHRELELDPDSVFIAAMGDLRRKKKLQDLTWAFDLIRVIHPKVHLVVIGEGECEEELRAFVRPAASADGVHVLGFRADANEILRQSFCFWQMSDDEGCSNALLEAMAMGLPIVASDNPGHRELLSDGKYGSLVDLGDCAEMARKTNVIMGDAQQVFERSRQQYVLERYSLNEMIDRFQAIYAAMLKSRPVAA